jgi:hypothetical protein
MREKARKLLLRSLEIISFVILTPIIFFAAFTLLGPLIEYYVYERISKALAFFIVLSFDAIWTVTVILLPLKNIHLKIVLIWLVLILSAATLFCLFVLQALSGAFA